jgi:hypothetical protein
MMMKVTDDEREDRKAGYGLRECDSALWVSALSEGLKRRMARREEVRSRERLAGKRYVEYETLDPDDDRLVKTAEEEGMRLSETSSGERKKTMPKRAKSA